MRRVRPQRGGGGRCAPCSRARPCPTPYFCFNDTVALGAIRGLAEAGLRVPDDVALIGVDDIEDGEVLGALADHHLPRQGADRRPLAVDLLIGRITGERKGPPEELEVPFRLVVRESSAGRVLTPG